jgi:Na+/H+-dicarboxylate symporter
MSTETTAATKKPRIALHWQIVIGMIAGVAFGFVARELGLNDIVKDWVAPFGTVFINMLKLIAVPLIITSLIKGVSDLQDIAKFSKMGGRTIALYLFTTVVAVAIGLLIANVVGPGKRISKETRDSMLPGVVEDDAAGEGEMAENGEQSAEQKKLLSIQATVDEQKEKGPLQPLVDIIPANIFEAASSNSNMLQVIFFVVAVGIGLILIEPEKAQPVKAVFDGLNEVVLKLVDLIMLVAPIGVFALLASLVTSAQGADVFVALGMYSLCVVAGLATMVFVFYPGLVVLLTKRSYGSFFRGISPAQLLAFSTSSSAATLPVTMERVEEHLGVEKEVTSFVLPVGATVNMDGTSLYQAVAAIFIAQVMGIDLTLGNQLTIVVTATLASIGSAAVPGAGVVMLAIVLQAIGVPAVGIALIFPVDRLLDMCRTVVNVTGDATVSMLVAKSIGKLNDPNVKNWDDNYPPDAPDEAQSKAT